MSSSSSSCDRKQCKQYILCIGSSVTEGYYDPIHRYPYSNKLLELLNKHYSNIEWHIHNSSISGECISERNIRIALYELLYNELQLSIQQNIHYSMIIIQGGSNDIRLGCNTMDIIDALYYMYKLSLSYGAYLITMTIQQLGNIDKSFDYIHKNEFRLFNAYHLQQRDSINVAIKSYVNKDSQYVKIYDFDILFPRWTLSASELSLLWSDDIHPSKYGYDIIGNQLYTIIDKIIQHNITMNNAPFTIHHKGNNEYQLTPYSKSTRYSDNNDSNTQNSLHSNL